MTDIELRWMHQDPDNGDSHAAAHGYIAAHCASTADRTLFAIAARGAGATIRVRTHDTAVKTGLTGSDAYLRSIEGPSICNGTRHRFVLTANAAEHRTGGRIEPVVDETAALAWLSRKASTGGFEVEAVALILPSLSIPRRTGSPARLHRVRFAGTLGIVDECSFSKTLSSGIGRGKAFGLGMLIVLAEDH